MKVRGKETGKVINSTCNDEDEISPSIIPVTEGENFHFCIFFSEPFRSSKSGRAFKGSVPTFRLYTPYRTETKSLLFTNDVLHDTWLSPQKGSASNTSLCLLSLLASNRFFDTRTSTVFRPLGTKFGK